MYLDYLAIFNIVLLSIISLFHFYWAFGGALGLDVVLPMKDGINIFTPGKISTFCVGLLTLGFAFVLYILQFTSSPSVAFIYAGWLISGIFILRAIGEFDAIGFFKKVKDSKFAKYDTLYYSPLVLFMGLCFLSITYFSFRMI